MKIGNTRFSTLTSKNFEYFPLNGNQMWYGNTRFGFVQINLLSSVVTFDHNGFKSLYFAENRKNVLLKIGSVTSHMHQKRKKRREKKREKKNADNN